MSPEQLINDFASDAAEQAKNADDPERVVEVLAKRRYNLLSEAEKRPHAAEGLLRPAPDRRFRTVLAYLMFSRGMTLVDG